MIPAVSRSPDSGEGRPEAPAFEAAMAAFLAAWLGSPSPAQCRALGEALDGIARALDQAWPAGPPHLATFWAELARCVPEGVGDDELPAALGRLHAVELHLAFACRQGHAGALARFEREHVAALGPAVGRVDSSPAFVDEIKQRLRTKLLVADESGPPKLAHYTGQGELWTWVRVVAVREALSSVRSERRQALAADDELLALEASATGPELGALKQQYREQFAEAFAAALGELEPAQRNLLRLHYLHGLSIDELGGLLRIHRSSAARRIVKTRETLLTGTRRSLQARLSLGRRDFEQLMGLVASRLDLSIERFLGERDGEAVGAEKGDDHGGPPKGAAKGDHSPGTQ
jgi:RNA polymerase sigma-70 factor (ECF subfamily)